jgi:hypothetical protein
VSGPASRSAIVLCVLTVLFGVRVVGQALVAFFDVTWLPVMDAWFSGLLPYPVLFTIQIVILLVQTVIDRDVWRSQGFFVFHWVLAAYLFTLGRIMRTPRTALPSVSLIENSAPWHCARRR